MIFSSGLLLREKETINMQIHQRGEDVFRQMKFLFVSPKPGFDRAFIFKFVWPCDEKEKQMGKASELYGDIV